MLMTSGAGPSTTFLVIVKGAHWELILRVIYVLPMMVAFVALSNPKYRSHVSGSTQPDKMSPLLGNSTVMPSRKRGPLLYMRTALLRRAVVIISEDMVHS